MVTALLDELGASLLQLTQPGQPLHGIRTVEVGDIGPIPDRDFPQITLDLAGVGKDSTGLAPGSRKERPLNLILCLYVSNRDPRQAKRQLWDLTFPVTPDASNGLLEVLSSFQRYTTDSGTVFRLERGDVDFGDSGSQQGAFREAAFIPIIATTQGRQK